MNTGFWTGSQWTWTITARVCWHSMNNILYSISLLLWKPSIHPPTPPWQNPARLQVPSLISNENGCLEYCSSACWQNCGQPITILTWSLTCFAPKQTTYIPWMNPDLELNVYLCVIRVSLILASLVRSHRILTGADCNTNVDGIVKMR